MAHLVPAVTHPTTKPFISITYSTKTVHLASSRLMLKVWASTTASHRQLHVQRRSITLWLAGVVVGLSVGSRNATAAARRPPLPPPSEEKKDPNVSGVTAKVLASKKRKEAMKESIAKLREKGKLVQDPSQ